MRHSWESCSEMCRDSELTFIFSGATTLSTSTFQERSNELRNPCTVVCFIYWLYNTALLEDCINKQYKCVLLLLYPMPITFIFCITFHMISCWQSAPFFIKKKPSFYFLMKKICDVKSPMLTMTVPLQQLSSGNETHSTLLQRSCIACIDMTHK